MFTNWKTTLAGLVTGVLNLSANGHSVKQLLVSAGVVVLGALASDAQAKLSK
jgi:hypothetical protein